MSTAGSLALSFLAPVRLWLLLGVVALAALYVFVQWQRRSYAVRFTNLDLLSSVAPRRPGWRRHVPAVLLLLALLMLGTAFARPTWNVRTPQERATVVLALDVSRSMEATDVAPNRLQVARRAIRAFADALPPRVRVGLVTFAGTAAVVVQPTTNRDALERAVDQVRLANGTAIGEGIFTSLDLVESVAKESKQGAVRVVLLSDGARNAGRTNEAAAEAAVELKVPVDTIAFGTDDGTVEIENTPVTVPVDREALEEIANTTGGKFRSAVTADELRSAYDDIGSVVGYTTKERDATAWFIGFALAAAFLAAAGALLWTSRLP